LASDVNNPDIVGHFANRISAFIFVAVEEFRKKNEGFLLYGPIPPGLSFQSKTGTHYQ
jgi:hypothetical protein